MEAIQIPGIVIAYMIAGFAGGLVSLSYAPPTSFLKGVSTIITSVIVSNYLTNIVQAYLELRPQLEHGAAFLVGLIAQWLVAGILKKAEVWSKDPTLPNAPPKGPQ